MSAVSFAAKLANALVNDKPLVVEVICCLLQTLLSDGAFNVSEAVYLLLVCCRVKTAESAFGCL